MWYENIISQLDKDVVYTRKQLYDLLSAEKSQLSYNSFKWIISEMISNGHIYKKQRNQYILKGDVVAEKQIYMPFMSEELKQLSDKIKTKFPLLEFVCFESVQLNTFLNHLIGRNTLFVLVEKDAIDFVFRYLQEEGVANILLKPNAKEWDAYCTGDNIVLLNLVSEAPKGLGEYKGMCIEQLLVDLIAEKTFRFLYSKSELNNIFEKADQMFLIDYARIMRYARRRGKSEEIRKYIGGADC